MEAPRREREELRGVALRVSRTPNPQGARAIHLHPGGSTRPRTAPTPPLSNPSSHHLNIMGEQIVLRGELLGHGGWVTAIATTVENPNMILTSSRDKVIIITVFVFSYLILLSRFFIQHCWLSPLFSALFLSRHHSPYSRFLILSPCHIS